MRKSKFTESQIISAIKQHESGVKAEDICRDLGIHRGTFYTWKKKYSGMDNLQLRRLKELEEENRKLKQMPACRQAGMLMYPLTIRCSRMYCQKSGRLWFEEKHGCLPERQLSGKHYQSM